MAVRALPAVTLVALLLAACSGGASGPPSAHSLALRLPGCHKPFTPSGGVAVQAATVQACLTPSAEVFVATFTSAGLERQWITAQQADTCEAIQGQGWAAVVLPTVADFCGTGAAVAKALGGRLVSS